MAEGSPCPKCAAPVPAGETFCAGCGYRQAADAAEQADVGARIGLRQAKQAFTGKVRSGRGAILAVSILTALGAVGFYFLLQTDIDRAQREVDGARGNPAYDQASVEAVQRDIDRARDRVPLVIAVIAGLAVVFFLLWLWAARKPLPATVSALILYVTILAIDGVVDPKSLLMGWPIKLIIILALIKGVDAAQKYQKMRQQGL